MNPTKGVGEGVGELLPVSSSSLLGFGKYAVCSNVVNGGWITISYTTDDERGPPPAVVLVENMDKSLSLSLSNDPNQQNGTSSAKILINVSIVCLSYH